MDKQKFYNQLCEEENQLLKEVAELTETLTAVQVLKRRYQSEISDIVSAMVNETQSETVKREYKKRNGAKAVDHVLEALALISSGTANQVASTMLELYPDVYTEDKAKGNAKFLLSKLNRDGKINGNKIEGKNYFLYSLKTTEKENDWINT